MWFLLVHYYIPQSHLALSKQGLMAFQQDPIVFNKLEKVKVNIFSSQHVATMCYFSPYLKINYQVATMWFFLSISREMPPSGYHVIFFQFPNKQHLVATKSIILSNMREIPNGCHHVLFPSISREISLLVTNGFSLGFQGKCAKWPPSEFLFYVSY